MSQDKAEELLQNSKEQKRHSSEPSQSDNSPNLQDAIQEAFADIDDGDATSNITVRDENLAALFLGLETTAELEQVAAEAQAELDRDAESNVSRSGTLGALARIGLQEVAPDTLEKAADARDEYVLSRQDGY